MKWFLIFCYTVAVTFAFLGCENNKSNLFMVSKKPIVSSSQYKITSLSCKSNHSLKGFNKFHNSQSMKLIKFHNSHSMIRLSGRSKKKYKIKIFKKLQTTKVTEKYSHAELVNFLMKNNKYNLAYSKLVNNNQGINFENERARLKNDIFYKAK